MASQKLNPARQSPILFQWLKPGLALAFGIALVIVVNIKSNRQNEMSKLVIAESPEMVLNFKNIELMADAGVLSEEDWKKIGGER